MKLKVGMRIICKKPYDGNFDIMGKMGRIIETHGSHCIIQFDKKIESGHDGWGYGKYGHCWSMPISYVKPIDFKQRIK